MSEVHDVPQWLSASYPYELLNDTDEHARDWYYKQASDATQKLSFPETRVAERYALYMYSEFPETGSKATQAKLHSYWMGVKRQVAVRRGKMEERPHTSLAIGQFRMDDPDRTAYKKSLVAVSSAKLREKLAQQWESSLQPNLCPEDCVSYLQNVADVELEFWKRIKSAPTSGFGSVNESQNTTSSFVLPFRSPDDITINQKGY